MLAPNGSEFELVQQCSFDTHQKFGKPDTLFSPITVTALMEDFELGEEIQSGFASRGNPSHLFGRFEGALHRFNASVEEMLAG